MADRTEYQCEVKEVYSGDDLIVHLDLEIEGLWKRQRVRLHGVDTPNGVRATPDSEAGKVRAEIRAMTRNRKAVIRVISRGTTSWIVILVVETPAGPKDINDYLIEKGYRFNRQAVEKEKAPQINRQEGEKNVASGT